MDERPQQRPEGQLIAAALKQARISQREAARRAGMSENRWRAIVHGYQTVSAGSHASVRGPAETLARMAQVVGVTPEQLIGVGRGDAAEELRALAEPQRPAGDMLVEMEKALTRIEKAIEAHAGDRDRPLGEAAMRTVRAILENSTNDTADR